MMVLIRMFYMAVWPMVCRAMAALQRAETILMLVKRIACVALFAAIMLLSGYNPQNVDWSLQWAQATHAVTLIGLCTMLYMWRWGRKGVACIGWLAAKLRLIPDRIFVSGLAAAFFIMTCYLSGALFQHVPHVADSEALYMQSKIFASGHIYLPSHPFARFFDMQYVFNDGKYFTMYPPGHPALLALGQLIGLPWMINPLLGALFIVSMYYLGREIGGGATGRIAALLGMISPFVVFMSSEYMSHATTLLTTTLFVLFYIRTLKYCDYRDAIYAGMAMGMMVLTRPQCAAAIGFFFIPHAGFIFLTQLRRYGWRLIAMAAAVMPFLGLYGWYNWETTGNALVTAYGQMAYNGGDIWPWMGTWLTHWHEWRGFPTGDFTRAGDQIVVMNVELFCWPIASLLLSLLLFFFCAETRYAWILAMTFFFICLSLTLTTVVWAHLFGPRYLYEACGVVIALSALMIHRFPMAVRRRTGLRISARMARGMLAIAFVGMTIMGWYGRTGELYGLYGNNYWEGNIDFYNGTVSAVKAPALVFIPNYPLFRFVSFTMPPDDNAPIIFAQELPCDNADLLIRYYPNRRVYLMDADFTMHRLR